MTALWLLLGVCWGIALAVRRRRARKHADVLLVAGSTRDPRAAGGGF